MKTLTTNERRKINDYNMKEILEVLYSEHINTLTIERALGRYGELRVRVEKNDDGSVTLRDWNKIS